MSSETEQTLVLIKPDALRNSCTGYILSYLSEFHAGLVFAGAKIVKVTTMLAEEHYAEHVGKGFFPSLLQYISGELHYPENAALRRVIALVYQGPGAVLKVRDFAGPTNPNVARETKPGCIRSLGTIMPIKDGEGNVVGDRMDNLIHASANPDDAEREIKLWFTPQDIPAAMRTYPTAVCKENYFFTGGKLTTEFSDGAVSILAPGTLAWETDLAALRKRAAGEESAITAGAVCAKYLLNVE